MAERVARIVLTDLLAQRVVRAAPELAAGDGGENRQFFVKLLHAIAENEAVLVILEHRVHADVGALAGRDDVVPAPDGLLHIDLGAVVQLQERFEAAAVVVVRVGQKGDVDLCKINAERRSVVDELRVRAHVEKNFVLVGLNIHRQAVRAGNALLAAAVFHQNDDFHQKAPFLCYCSTASP